MQFLVQYLFPCRSCEFDFHVSKGDFPKVFHKLEFRTYLKN